MSLPFMENPIVLIAAAVAPVILLCFFIYSRDRHKEPKTLLAKLFGFGLLSTIPVVIVELVVSIFFSTENSKTYVNLFINVFVSVAAVEEGFKWIFTKRVGYDGKEFDEIYDIIVYAVFVSLGFACLENILYVFNYGFSNALLRALTSIPGHTCFAIAMGFYLSKAKIASLNGNKKLYKKNVILSLLVPMLFHTAYDFFAFAGMTFLFYGFHICMVIYCLYNVYKVSKMQVNFSRNVSLGNITNNNGSIQYTAPVNNAVNNNVVNNTPANNNIPALNFCPICGAKYHGGKFCGNCGFRLR